MDSPVRLQLKRNDYLRHKLFRKINRRRRAKRQLDIEAPVKELRKRLRLKRTFEDGKDGDGISKSSDFSDEQLSRLVTDEFIYRDPEYSNRIDPIYRGEYLNVLESNGWSNDKEHLQGLKYLYDQDQLRAFPRYSFNAGPLPEIIVKPDYKEEYNILLETFYPFHRNRYPLTGHSILRTPGGNEISTGFDDKDYNLILNNCSDATRKALEQAYHKAINPFLFTTPGDVKDFAESELNGRTLNFPSTGMKITKIPANLQLLQQIANYAKQIKNTGKYAGGKDGEDDSTIKTIASFLPFVGTAIDGYDVVANKQYDKLPLFLIGLGGDVLGFGAAAKAYKAYKAYKALTTARRLAPNSVSMPLLRKATTNVTKAQRRAVAGVTADAISHSENIKDLTKYAGGKDGETTNNRKEDYPEINWMKQWLWNRRDILEKNANATTWRYDKYKPKKNKGDVREAGWDVDMYDNLWNPFTYFKNSNPTRNRVNKLIYAQIENASNVPKTNVGYGTSSNYDMKGVYVRPNYWDNTGNYVAFAGTPDPDVKVHEFTHASNPIQQEYYIDDVIFNRHTPQVVPNHKRSSIDNARELYGALLLFRFKNKLLPTLIIDKKYLDDHRDLFKGTYLENISDEDKLRLFNEVAYNNIGSEYNYDEPYITAADGKDPGIHIKPQNRGKFTRLKKRTGHSTAWFKAHGTPAQKKMATFALNSKKFKH